MQVARSGYDAWRHRLPSAQEQANQQLTQQIKRVHAQSDQAHGSPRIYHELKEAGISCSEKRIACLMHQGQLYACTSKRFVVTTDSNHALPIAENLLDRHFSVDTPDPRWSADITYIHTGEGWLYLAIVLDLFSRRVVGWARGETLGRSLVLSALIALTFLTVSHKEEFMLLLRNYPFNANRKNAPHEEGAIKIAGNA